MGNWASGCVVSVSSYCKVSVNSKANASLPVKGHPGISYRYIVYTVYWQIQGYLLLCLGAWLYDELDFRRIILPRVTCTHVTIILVLNTFDYLSTDETGNARAEAVRVVITTSSTWGGTICNSEGLADTYSYTYDTSLVYRYVLQSQTSQTEYGRLLHGFLDGDTTDRGQLWLRPCIKYQSTRTPGIMYVCNLFDKGGLNLKATHIMMMMMMMMEVDTMDLRISRRLWCYARSWTHGENEIWMTQNDRGMLSLCIVLCSFTFGCISNRMRRDIFDWTVLINHYFCLFLSPNAHPLSGVKASNQSRPFLSTASAVP